MEADYLVIAPKLGQKLIFLCKVFNEKLETERLKYRLDEVG